MQKIITLLFFITSLSTYSFAQSQIPEKAIVDTHNTVDSLVTKKVTTEQTPIVSQFGYIHYDSIFQAMPEYINAMAQWKTLKEQYDDEINYNERGFKQQFADFLEGQKNFPVNIMLKRQSDLQNAMERSIAFRHRADSLLSAARQELLLPVRQKLNETLFLVGQKRHYLFIVNLDDNTMPYINSDMGEDATPYIEEFLIKSQIRKN